MVQSAFRTFLTGVNRGLYDVPDGQDLWALLVVVALNKVRAYARAAGAGKRAGGRRLSDPAAETLPDRGAVDPALAAAAEDVLAQFPPRERELIDLRLAGHPVETIARQLDRSKRTVERTLQTCRERLLTLMADHE